MSEQWAIVEVMGHRRHVGVISEVVRFGATFLQVDAVVENDLDVRRTHLYPAASLFGVSPISEEQARAEVAPYAPVLRQLPASRPFRNDRAEWALEVLRLATLTRVSGALDKAGSGNADLSEVQRDGLVSLSAAIASGIEKNFINADGTDPDDDSSPDSCDPKDLQDDFFPN